MYNLSTEKTFFLFLLIFGTLSKSFQYEFLVVRDGKHHENSGIVKRQVSSELPKITEFLVVTNVANRFAETTVISNVENLDSNSKQTAFSVVLPEGAFISGFFMEIDKEKYTALVEEREKAQQIFGQALSTGQTAGHVSVSTRNSNRFTININVEPLSKVKFQLNYEELLQRKEGEYEVIANIQPGQLVKKLKVEVRINESLPLNFIKTPFVRSGSNSSMKSVDPHAKVRFMNNSAIVVFDPSVSRQLEFSCAGFGNEEFNGFAGQFVVKYDVIRTGEGGETIYQDGYLLNFFAPSTKSFDPLPKHIVFVLDSSGSMEGQKISQLIDAMLKILPQLNSQDIFSIVQYAEEVYIWDIDSNDKIGVLNGQYNYISYGNLAQELKNTYFPPAYEATKENIEKMQKLTNQLVADAGTNIIGGLEVALLLVQKAYSKNPGKYEPIIVFLTDGLPNTGIESTEEIIRIVSDLNKANFNTPIYSLCLGNDADWPFLRQLSISNYGKPTNITDDQESSDYLNKFYKSIANALMSNIKFDLPESAKALLTNFARYFNGSELVVVAKDVAENEVKPITVSGKAKQGHVNLQAELGVPLTKLEKVWAYLTVKQLSDLFYSTGNRTFSKLALDLALNYSLVSDFTSLVVVKPDNQKEPVTITDAYSGIFPQAPSNLPICQNYTNITEEDSTTTTEISTISGSIIEVEFSNTEKFNKIPTTIPTTVTVPTSPTTIATTTASITTEKIETCLDSTYGCCYDGVAFALRPNGDGCEPVPNAESCSLPSDKGTCNNITSKWYYSTIKHQCRLLRYGGCGGNGNRFLSKAICENTCVHPTDSERCKLPISLGRCNNKTLYWFYDKSKDECVKYMYGGCFGNSNRFHSKQECLKTCSPTKLKQMMTNLCFQPKDKGHATCRRFEKNYYFNSTTGQCTKFWFTGCGGNDNRFNSKEICEKMCSSAKLKALCSLPPEKGYCQLKYSIYYFDIQSFSCKSFDYTGCGGNRNKFLTLESCEATCLET